MRQILATILVVVALASGCKGVSTGSAPSGGSSSYGDFASGVTNAPKWAALRDKCDEPAVKLADEVAFAYKDLRKHNDGETYAALVKHLDHSIPADAAPMHCDQVIAAYLTIREG